MVPWWQIARTTLKTVLCITWLILKVAHSTNFGNRTISWNTEEQTFENGQGPNERLKNKSQNVVGYLPLTGTFPVNGKERWSTSKLGAAHRCGASGPGLLANVASSVCPATEEGVPCAFPGFRIEEKGTQRHAQSAQSHTTWPPSPSQ